MANLTAVPTKEGLEILNSELKQKATNFILIGKQNYNDDELDTLLDSDALTYKDIEPYIFYSSTIESSFYDENGVLTIECIIPVDEDLENYTYAIGIATEDTKELVTLTKMPKIVPIAGVGGSVIVKVAVKGTAGEIVFKQSEYITINEAQELFLKPVIANTAHLIALQNKLIEKGVIDG